MNASNAGNHLFLAQTEIPDPGASGSIVPDVSLGVCNLVSATAETRTLAAPLKFGVIATLHMKTDGGDITLTVTGGYNEAGTTSFTFSDAGQYITLISLYDGTNYYWRQIASSQGQSFSAATITDLTATNAAISNAAITTLAATNSTLTNVAIAGGTVTNATLSGLLTFADNGNVAMNATTGTRLATNNAQKMGLWGATPVIQPASTGELIGLNGNGATQANTVNINSNGNLGATLYSINDIVKALKQAGVLKS